MGVGNGAAGRAGKRELCFKSPIKTVGTQEPAKEEEERKDVFMRRPT